MTDPTKTPHAPLGDAQTPRPHPDPSPQAGARPWHTEVGWDGALTAVVDVNGYLVCDCEPHIHEGKYTNEKGAAEANARLIVAAVNQHAACEALIAHAQEIANALRDSLNGWPEKELSDTPTRMFRRLVLTLQQMGVPTKELEAELFR